MKTTLLSLTCALVASVAFSQEVSRSTTTTTASGAGTTTTSVSSTTSTGTLEEYTPGSAFIVKEKSGPVKYRYGKHVTYVTKKGKTLSDDEVRTRVKVGSPVTVHYGSEGSDRVIERVEVDDD